MIYIIIITYNATPWLQKCLDSCKGYQVIIVDNKSTDGTIAFIKEKYPQMHLLPQKENLGFGQANNIGIKYALAQGADYVFLLNQDAYLQKECIETLIETHKKNTTYGILSPIHLNGQGNRLDRNFSNYVNYTANPDFYSDFVLKKPQQEVYEVPFVNAAGWLLYRKILETVGGFDPIFFHYGEDDNYCQRARFHGFKIGVVPTAFLWHDREDRQSVVFENKQQEEESAFKQLERKLKTKWGDINLENIDPLDIMLLRKQKQKVKAMLKLQIAHYHQLAKEINLIKRVKSELLESRHRNKKSLGPYLS